MQRISPLAQLAASRVHAQPHHEDRHQHVLGDHKRDDRRQDAERTRPGGRHHRYGRGHYKGQTPAEAAHTVVVGAADGRRCGRWGYHGHAAYPVMEAIRSRPPRTLLSLSPAALHGLPVCEIEKATSGGLTLAELRGLVMARDEIVLYPEQFLERSQRADLRVALQIHVENRTGQGVAHETHQGIHLD
jgi:hypothetical protein